MRRASLCLLMVVGCSTAAGDEPTTSTIEQTTTSQPASTTTATTTTTTVAETTATTIDDFRVELEIEVVGGVVTPPFARVNVPLGNTVRIEVRSDAADEIHVHGYDLFAEVGAGGDVSIEFVADAPGIFEVEMERARLPLVELQVSG